MQISSRFTMAIHMFACIDTFTEQKMTSDFMAGSIGTNPVIVRKILQQLKAAGLVEVSRGTGGDYACRCEKRYGYVDCKRRNVKERVKKECTEMPPWR